MIFKKKKRSKQDRIIALRGYTKITMNFIFNALVGKKITFQDGTSLVVDGRALNDIFFDSEARALYYWDGMTMYGGFIVKIEEDTDG